MTTAIDIARANFEARQKIQQSLAEIDEKCTAENRGYNDDESGTIAEKRSELKAIDDRIQANLAMEVRSQANERAASDVLGAYLDSQSHDLVDTRSIGSRFTDSGEFRSFAEGSANRSEVARLEGVDFRAVSDVTNSATSGGALINPARLDRIGQSFLQRRTFLVDVLPVIPVNGPIEYVKDASPLADLHQKAVEVAEGGAKPQAGPTMSVVSESPATIAAWVNITRRVARQAPAVQAYLDGKLRYSLKRRFDSQVINGDGNSPNLAGLLNRSGILTEAPGSSEARAATIRKAITTMEESEAVPEIIVLNPGDHELFDLLNLSSAGLTAVPNLQSGPSSSTWGLTVVKSNAIAAGTAMLIDPMAIAILDEAAPRAYLTDSHASNFTSNILTLLLELDAGVALFDPSGVCKVTFNGTT